MTTVDLPKIPSLPPIEMSDALNFLASTPSSPEERDTLSPLHLSSTSLVSQDTFMTANSTLSPDPIPLNSATSTDLPPSSSHLLLPKVVCNAGLRKSLSIDSFTRSKHQPTPLTVRPTRVNTTSSIHLPHPRESVRLPSTSLSRREDPHPPPPNGTKRDQEKPPIPPRTVHSRTRGASISTVADDSNTSLFDNSDIERSDELPKTVAKGKSLARDSIPEGALTLPPRLSLAAPSPPSPLTNKSPIPIVPERNSSLSHALPKNRSLMSVNTHLSVSIHLPPHQTPC